MSLPRFFVESVSHVDPNLETGIVKLNFAVSGSKGQEDVVQLIISSNDLQEVFAMVGDTMQRTFGGEGAPPPGYQGGRPGGPRGPGGGGGPGRGSLPTPPNQGFKDITQE